MVNKSITDYISKSRQKGLSDIDIKSQLEKVGWKLNDVDDAFKNLDESDLLLSILLSKSVACLGPNVTPISDMTIVFFVLLTIKNKLHSPYPGQRSRICF